MPGNQVELDVGAVGQRLARRLPGLVVELTLAHEAELFGPAVVIDDVAVTIDDGGAQRHQRNDALEHLRDGDSGRVDGHALASFQRPRR